MKMKPAAKKQPDATVSELLIVVAVVAAMLFFLLCMAIHGEYKANERADAIEKELRELKSDAVHQHVGEWRISERGKVTFYLKWMR